MRYRFIAIVAITLALHAAVSYSQEGLDPRALDSYMKGVFLESRHNPVQAYRFYKYAERYAPGNSRIKVKLARIALELGELDKASGYAMGLLEKGDYSSEAIMILVEIEYRRGNREAALERLLELSKREDVPRFDVLKALSRIYLELGRVEEARDVLEEARMIFSEDLYVNYKLGYIYIDLNEFDKAIESFEKTLELDPGLPDIHTALASLYLEAGRREEAKRSYRDALEYDPANSTAIRELVGLLYTGGEFEEGIEFLEPLYTEGKLDDGGELTLGKFYYRGGRIDDALAVFKKLLEKMDEYPPLLRVISEIEIERGHFKTAYGYLTRLIELEPEKFTNYIGLLLIANDLAGDPSGPDESVTIPTSEAERYLAVAVGGMDGESVDDNYLIGTVYRRMGNDEEAQRYLLRAEVIDPDEGRTLLELASLFEGKGQFDEALKRVVHLYERDPENPRLLNFYGYLLAEKGEKLDLAKELLIKALDKDPENGYYMDSYGWVMFQKGDYGRALKILVEASERVVDDAVIWEHIGDTYGKLDMQAEALNAYKKSLSLEPDREVVKEKVHLLEASSPSNEK